MSIFNKIADSLGLSNKLEEERAQQEFEVRMAMVKLREKTRDDQLASHTKECLSVDHAKGSPAAVEKEAALHSLLEHAWKNKQSFIEFAQRTIIGNPPIAGVKLSQQMIDELQFLSDMVLGQFDLEKELATGSYMISTEQKKRLNTLTKTDDPWSRAVGTKEFKCLEF